MDEKTLNEKLQEIASGFPKPELDREKEKDLLSRIVMSPGVYDGTPTLRASEVPVGLVLHLLGRGHPGDRICRYLSLSEADMQAVFLYAGSLVEERSQAGNFMSGGGGNSAR